MIPDYLEERSPIRYFELKRIVFEFTVYFPHRKKQ